MMTMIKVTLNGDPADLPDHLTLRSLVEHLHLPAERIAIEHNRAIVKRKDWSSVEVHDGDGIEIVQFVGGGM